MASTTSTTSSASTKNPTVWPTLVYRDAKAAIDFLGRAFGFEAAFVVPGDDTRPVPHAQLHTPWGGGVMVSSRAPDGPFASLGPASIYVVVDGPDALLERATAAGAEIVLPIEDTDYGSRGFTARDPEGNLWSFGTYGGE